VPEIPQDGQFASFFDGLLTSLHLSNAAAARRLHVAQSQVGRWRRGEGGISKENIRRIHEEFGVDFDYLLGLAGLRTSTPAIALEGIEADRQMWRALRRADGKDGSPLGLARLHGCL
jgi:transcriptional regulator with XRE-family HTH domain